MLHVQTKESSGNAVPLCHLSAVLPCKQAEQIRKMPQLLQEQMPEPQRVSQVEHDLKKIAEKYGLKAEELRVHGDSAFIDGLALLDRQIDATGLGEDFFRCTSDVSLIVVLPVTASFSKERDLIRKVAAAGGSVARPPQGSGFLQFVSEFLERVKFTPRAVEPKISAPPVAKLDTKAFLSPYYYSQEELRDLRRAYREEDDSPSIVS
jgi:hypothetical protein